MLDDDGTAVALPSPKVPESPYFLARHQGDVATAVSLLNQSRNAVRVERHSVARAWSAILCATGDLDGARQWATKGLDAIRQSTESGLLAAEADWLQEIITLCDSAAPMSPSVPEAADGGMA